MRVHGDATLVLDEGASRQATAVRSRRDRAGSRTTFTGSTSCPRWCLTSWQFRTCHAGAQCSCAGLDLAAAERLAHAAFDAHPDEQTRLLLAYILYLNGNAPEVEKMLGYAENDCSAMGFVNSACTTSTSLIRAVSVGQPWRRESTRDDVKRRQMTCGDVRRSDGVNAVNAKSEPAFRPTRSPALPPDDRPDDCCGAATQGSSRTP
jgi:hypothetical protein